MGDIRGASEDFPAIVSSWADLVTELTTRHDDLTTVDGTDDKKNYNDYYIKFADDASDVNKTIDFNSVNPYGLDPIDLTNCVRARKTNGQVPATNLQLVRLHIHIDGNGWTWKNMVINSYLFTDTLKAYSVGHYNGVIESIKNLSVIDFVHKGSRTCFDVGDIQDCKFVGSTNSEHDFFSCTPRSASLYYENNGNNDDDVDNHMCPFIFRHNSVNILMVGRYATSLFSSGGNMANAGTEASGIPRKDQYAFNNIVVSVNSPQSYIHMNCSKVYQGFTWQYYESGDDEDRTPKLEEYEGKTIPNVFPAGTTNNIKGIPYENLVGYPFSLFYFGRGDTYNKYAPGYGFCSSKIRIIFGKKSVQETTAEKPRTVILYSSDSCRYDITYEGKNEHEKIIVLPSGTKGTSSSIVSRTPEWDEGEQNKFINNTLFVTNDKITDITYLQSYGFLAAK